MSRSLDRMTDVILCCPSQIDHQRLRFIFGTNADSFKRQLNSFRLCSDLISQYLQTCNPTSMLFAEDIEEVGPFVTRNFSPQQFCREMLPGFCSITKNHRTLVYDWLTATSFFLKTCIAIGIVLASPERNKDQPSAFRFARLNLSASNSPAPNPIAPRVAAMIAISGIVKVLTFDFDIFTCHLVIFCTVSGTLQMRLKPLSREVGHLVYRSRLFE